jgi:hypothetical protein
MDECVLRHSPPTERLGSDRSDDAPEGAAGRADANGEPASIPKDQRARTRVAVGAAQHDGGDRGPTQHPRREPPRGEVMGTLGAAGASGYFVFEHQATVVAVVQAA